MSYMCHITVTFVVLSFHSSQRHSNLHLELDLSELKFCSNLDFFSLSVTKKWLVLLWKLREALVWQILSPWHLWDACLTEIVVIRVCIEMKRSIAFLSLSKWPLVRLLTHFVSSLLLLWGWLSEVTEIWLSLFRSLLHESLITSE